MKYILNETPVRTSNNYKINNIEVEMDIPSIKSFSKYSVDGISYKETDDKNFESRIGLSFEKYHKLDIDITNEKNINILYDIVEDILVDNININLAENSDSVINIKYESHSNINHHMKLVINGGRNSKAIINFINILSSDSKNFVAIEKNLDTHAFAEVNYIDFSGGLRVINYYSSLIGIEAKSIFNNIYIGKNEERIDMNYYAGCIGEKTTGIINVCGALTDTAYKTFKGTIDFIEGSKKSVGKEKENVILLSDTCKSRSLPILLCHEEDVEGAHGIATGKIDKEKLFYLMSRGMDEVEAKKLIIKSNFNYVIDKLDENIKELILKEIDNLFL